MRLKAINRSYSRKIFRSLPFIFLFAFTFWLRLANLGYSDYQGDEIKALTTDIPTAELSAYLFQQRRGPLQFIITHLVGFFDPAYANEFIARLPFASAGILAVVCFYYFVRLHFGPKTALVASSFLTVNGLFIGLTRIVQYQSLVILFAVAALYSFSLAIYQQDWEISGIFLGMIFWAAAMLAHLDGIFIAPIVVYLLSRWFQRRSNVTRQIDKLGLLLLSAGIAMALVASFYLPYFRNLSSETLVYWQGRFSGEEVGAGIASTIYTFQLYNPLLARSIYLVMGPLAVLTLRRSWPVIVWFLFPWLVLEVVVNDPGTHIYIYLLPLTILLALGYEVLEDLVRRLIKQPAGIWLLRAALALQLVFLGVLSHKIFVDHTPEYPWESTRFLFWDLEQADKDYQLWLFGFPYNRGWEQIGAYLTAIHASDYYTTNENKSIARGYVPYEFDIERAGYYIHINHPQSFSNFQRSKDKIRYWTKNYPPIKEIYVENRKVAEIYLMPRGDIKALKEAGY